MKTIKYKGYTIEVSYNCNYTKKYYTVSGSSVVRWTNLAKVKNYIKLNFK